MISERRRAARRARHLRRLRRRLRWFGASALLMLMAIQVGFGDARATGQMPTTAAGDAGLNFAYAPAESRLASTTTVNLVAVIPGPDVAVPAVLASAAANVPEPASVALLMVGATGLGLMGGRQRRAGTGGCEGSGSGPI